MFRKMRRIKQELSTEDAIRILKISTNGVLALLGDDDYPYAVPLSFVYNDNKIYFHSAAEGHKIDAIKKSSKASFCVVSKDNVVPERFTTSYESVIAFGEVKLIEEKEEKINILKLLAKKYSPHQSEENTKNEIDGSINHVMIIEFEIQSITGKKSKII